MSDFQYWKLNIRYVKLEICVWTSSLVEVNDSQFFKPLKVFFSNFAA